MLLDYIQPPISIVIVGAGNDAIPLSQMADLLGWEVKVVDGRNTHAKQDRFISACQVLVSKPEKVLEQIKIDNRTCFVLMTHNFHWNVTGPHFNTLHTMFMAQYTEQWTALDLIAERIRALGHPAPGTYKEFMNLASIKEVSGSLKAMGMVHYLVNAQEATAKTARGLFPIVDKANDQPTADLLTQRIDVHEKTAWMLRSLLETD